MELLANFRLNWVSEALGWAISANKLITHYSLLITSQPESIDKLQQVLSK
ncbi:MAG: hypothetical protein F6K47_13960 [Symploca sp. SIO2E6]|nr:hypothetical protein [Symploca sp. SIO2E6]